MALERENVKPVLAVILAALFAQAQAPKKMAGRIRIETAPSGAIRFTPAEIVAWAGDTIHWFNDTDEAHEPGVIRKDGAFVAFLETPVAPRSASAVFSPFARINAEKNQIAFTIHYVCRRHRNEQGTIEVQPTP